MRPGARSEAGQTTALVCAMLFTLAMFVALVVNAGQLVNRRVSLQLVADSGAWSGATVQAVALNHYAFWSRFMQNAYKNASGVSLNFNFSECWSGVAAAALVVYGNAGMKAAIARFNLGNMAYNEAERHSQFNIDDLFPGESNNFSFSTNALSDGGVIAPASGRIVPLPLRRGERLHTGSHNWSRETLNQFLLEFSVRFTGRLPWATNSAGSGFESWQCATLLPPTSFRIPMPGFSGYKLVKLGQPFIFVWKVSERSATRAFFFDQLFGGRVVPPMTAVAVAKAVGGHVHEGRSRYRAKMLPVSRHSLTQGFIRDQQARPGRVLPNPWRRIVH